MGEKKMIANVWMENLKGGNNFEYLGVDGRIILKCI
jgi:hypothetical protein